MDTDGHWWTLGCRAHLGRAQSPGSWRWNDTGACAQRPVENTLRWEPAQYLGMQCRMRCGMAECNFSISFLQIKSSPNTKATCCTSEHIWAYVPCSKHGIRGIRESLSEYKSQFMTIPHGTWHLWTFHNRNFSNLSNLSCSIWGLDEGCHGSLPEGGIQLHEIGERPKKDPTKPPPNQNNLTLVTLVPYVPCLVHSVSAKSHFMIFPCYRSFPLPQM